MFVTKGPRRSGTSSVTPKAGRRVTDRMTINSLAG
jgi:hypothetical protein